MFGTDPHQSRDLFGRLGIGDRIGWGQGEMAFRLAMQIAIRLGPRDPIP